MARGRRPWLTDEEREQRKIEQREYHREYGRKRRAELKEKGESYYSTLTDDEKKMRVDRNRAWRHKKMQDPEWVAKDRERRRSRRVKKSKTKVVKKDFSDKDFSKWWHDKIESVRQILNY